MLTKKPRSNKSFSTSSQEVYSRYKHKAGARDVEFNLTLKQFSAIIRKNCAYCGRSARKSKTVSRGSKHGAIPYNGIDRIDARQGYEPWNVTPCCFDCNRAKGAQSVKEFKQWIRRVYERQFCRK